MKVVYPGTFDGLHYGHIDIIERASNMFNEVVVAVGVNEKKKPIFNAIQRVNMINECTKDLPNVSVECFDGMLGDYLWKIDANAVINALRDENDFKSIKEGHDVLCWDYDNLYETILLISNSHYRNYSSSMVKAIEYHGGDISQYVPGSVKIQLEEKISNRTFIGITGTIGAGKNYISDLMEKRGHFGVPVWSIDFDWLTNHIHTQLTAPGYVKFRKELIKEFGDIIHDKSKPRNFDYYFINKTELAKIVFNPKSQSKLHDLSNLLYEPTKHYFREFLRVNKMKGIILLNCAYLIETDLLDLCNGNVIIIDADEDIRRKRVGKRNGMSKVEFDIRSKNQMSDEEKIQCVKLYHETSGCGNLWTFVNNPEYNIEKSVDNLWEMIDGKLSL